MCACILLSSAAVGSNVYIKQNSHLNIYDHYLKVAVDSNDGKFGKKVETMVV